MFLITVGADAISAMLSVPDEIVSLMETMTR
jgi:hypothetical protein